MSDGEEQKRVPQRLRQLADALDLLTQPLTPELVPSPDALRIQNELSLCFNRPDINPDYMKIVVSSQPKMGDVYCGGLKNRF